MLTTAILAGVLAASAQYLPDDTVRITGRLVDERGMPTSFSVRLKEVGVMDLRFASPNKEGVFTFFVSPSRTYKIWLGSDHATPPKL